MEDETMANETSTNQEPVLTREIAMARFMAGKRRKQETVARLSKELERIYETKHGEKLKSITIW